MRISHRSDDGLSVTGVGKLWEAGLGIIMGEEDCMGELGKGIGGSHYVQGPRTEPDCRTVSDL